MGKNPNDFSEIAKQGPKALMFHMSKMGMSDPKLDAMNTTGTVMKNINSNWLSGGSGSFIKYNNNLYFLTNHHVIKYNNKVYGKITVRVHNYNNTGKSKVLLGNVTYSNARLDLAILKFPNHTLENQHYLEIHTKKPELGEKIFIVGQPSLNDINNVSDGVIRSTNWLDYDLRNVLYTSADIAGGNSGSPIVSFDEQSRKFKLIGILGQASTSTEQNQFTGGSDNINIISFLDRMEVEISKESNDMITVKSTHDIILNRFGEEIKLIANTPKKVPKKSYGMYVTKDNKDIEIYGVEGGIETIIFDPTISRKSSYMLQYNYEEILDLNLTLEKSASMIMFNIVSVPEEDIANAFYGTYDSLEERLSDEFDLTYSFETDQLLYNEPFASLIYSNKVVVDKYGNIYVGVRKTNNEIIKSLDEIGIDLVDRLNSFILSNLSYDFTELKTTNNNTTINLSWKGTDFIYEEGPSLPEGFEFVLFENGKNITAKKTNYVDLSLYLLDDNVKDLDSYMPNHKYLNELVLGTSLDKRTIYAYKFQSSEIFKNKQHLIRGSGLIDPDLLENTHRIFKETPYNKSKVQFRIVSDKKYQYSEFTDYKSEYFYSFDPKWNDLIENRPNQGNGYIAPEQMSFLNLLPKESLYFKGIEYTDKKGEKHFFGVAPDKENMASFFNFSFNGGKELYEDLRKGNSVNIKLLTEHVCGYKLKTDNTGKKIDVIDKILENRYNDSVYYNSLGDEMKEGPNAIRILEWAVLDSDLDSGGSNITWILSKLDENQNLLYNVTKNAYIKIGTDFVGIDVNDAPNYEFVVQKLDEDGNGIFDNDGKPVFLNASNVEYTTEGPYPEGSYIYTLIFVNETGGDIYVKWNGQYYKCYGENKSRDKFGSENNILVEVKYDIDLSLNKIKTIGQDPYIPANLIKSTGDNDEKKKPKKIHNIDNYIKQRRDNLEKSLKEKLGKDKEMDKVILKLLKDLEDKKN